MKLSDLRDRAESDLAADATAATDLLAAENRKIQTAGAVETSRRAFAHAIKGRGGKAVDASANPPRLYLADIDGEGYSVEDVPDLNADVADENSPQQTFGQIPTLDRGSMP